MDWFTGSKQGEAKRLIAQLTDAAKRDRAIQDLTRMGEAALPSLFEALQSSDPDLLPFVQQTLARIPAAVPILIKAIASAHPIIRGRSAEVFAISKDPRAVPALLEALNGQYLLCVHAPRWRWA